MPGAYWKMRTFKMAHLGPENDAYATVSSKAAIWKQRAVFHYLDILAAKSWIEMRETGRISLETREDLRLFDELDLRGRKHLLTLQGFLPASSDSLARASGSVGLLEAPNSAVQSNASDVDAPSVSRTPRVHTE